jgi:hypothetical protein
LDNIEIEILDSDNSIQGVLEVGNVKNFPLALTNGIADLRNIESKTGSYSTSFKIPSTKANDDLLEHIYISQQKNYKDMDAEKDCRIRVNGVDLEQGKLRITRIKGGGRTKQTDYSFKFFGNNMDWVLGMRGKTMQDLPYLDNTYTYSSANIISSWSNTGGSDDIVFSLLNRGERLTPNEVNVQDMLPDYFVTDVLDNAFKSVGYNFESTHFNTANSKQLIIPFFGNNFNQNARQELNKAIVKLDSSVTNFDTTFSHSSSLSFINIATITGVVASACNSFSAHGIPNGVTCLAANDSGTYLETPAPLRDNGNNFASNLYTCPFDGKYLIDVVLDWSYEYDPTRANHLRSMNYKMRRTRGVNPLTPAVMIPISPITTTTTVISATRHEVRNQQRFTCNYTSQLAGDILEVEYTFNVKYTGGNQVHTAEDFYYKLIHYPAITYFVPYNTIEEDDNINLKLVSDNTFSLLDIVTDLGRMFNIYFRTNPATKTVYAEPRDDFYNALNTATNKTDDIDASKQYTLTYNSSSYNKNQTFRYNEDSEDKYLIQRDKDEADIWMSYTHAYPSKFKEGTSKLSTKVLAATYTIEDIYCGGTEPPILARLWNEDDGTYPEFTSKFAPRVLYYNYSTQQNEDLISKDFQWKQEANKRTTIPYALPMPVVSETITMAQVAANLSFKEVEGDDGLWNDYYSKTAREIQEGKRLTIWLRFDLVDYDNFDFRDIIYFDNRFVEVEGYWRVEKVKSYKPTSQNISVEFELIQAKSFEALPVSVSDYTAATDNPVEDTPSMNDQPDSGGIDSAGSISSFRGSNIQGYDNVVADSSNRVIGDNLISSGTNQLIMGRYNVDVSTDTFNFLLGTPE